MDFLSLFLDTDFVILGVPTYNLTGLVPPFSHPGGYFVSLRTPWETREQQEEHMGVRLLVIGGVIWGPHLVSFLELDGLNSMFLIGLFPVHFLHRLLTAGG